MPSQIQIDNTLEQLLKQSWLNGVCIFYENDDSKNPPSEFINYKSLTGSSRNITIGRDKKKREFCTIVAEIRIQKGEGKGRATELSEEFAEIFENKLIGTYIKTFEADKNAVTTPTHYGINVVIGYWWDRGA